MPTLRDVKNSFETMISAQSEVLAGLKAERQGTQKDIRTADKTLTDAIAALLPEINYTILDGISQAVGTRDFSSMARGYEEQAQENRTHVLNLDRVWTCRAALETSYKNMCEGRDKAQAALKNDQTRINLATQKMQDIITHNENYDVKISPETITYFTTQSLWKFITDAAYRSGRKAFLEYSNNHGDYFTDLSALQQLQTESAQKKEALEALVSEIRKQERGLASYNDLNQQYKSPEQITQLLRNAVHDALLENPTSASAIAEVFTPCEITTAITTALVKMQALDKITDNLDVMIGQIEGTKRKIESPMSKINQGYHRKPSHNIRMDLPQIESAVKAQNSHIRASTSKAADLRTHVNSFTHSNSSNDSSYMFVQNMMLFHILTAPDADRGYALGTLGTNDNTTADLQSLAIPDMAAETDLSSAFNIEALNTPDIAMPDMKLDINTIDVPAIEIPTIEMPTIDIPSFSDTSSYSYDGGGGGGDCGGGGGGD